MALLTKTQGGLDFVAKAASAVNAVFTVLTQRGALLAQAFIDVFTNPKKAIEEFKAAISGIGTAVVQAAEAGAALEGANQRLRESERALNIERAASRAEIEKQKLLAEDVSKSHAEREAAARRAFSIENGLLNRQIELQQQRIANTKQEADLNGNKADDLDKVAEAQIRLDDLREESFGKQTELNNKVNELTIAGIQSGINAEIAAIDKRLSLLDLESGQRLEKERERIDAELEAKLDGIEKGSEAERQARQDAELELDEIAVKGRDERYKLQLERINATMRLELAAVVEKSNEAKAIEAKAQAEINELNLKTTVETQTQLAKADETAFARRLNGIRQNSVEALKIENERIEVNKANDRLTAQTTIKNQQELNEDLKSIDAKYDAERLANKRAIAEEESRLLDQVLETRLIKSKAGSKSEYDAEVAIVRKRLSDAVKDKSLATEDFQKIQAQAFKDLGDLADKKAADIANSIADIAQSISGTIGQIVEASSQAQLKSLDKQQAAALQSASLSAEQRTAIEANFQAEREKLEKKAAEQSKAFALVEVAINTARAIVAASATGALAPFLIPLAIATGLAQALVIQSQQFAKGGVIDGPSHAQGGVKYQIGNKRVELEGGEGVINKRSMANPLLRSVASHINQLGGGIAYPNTAQLAAAAVHYHLHHSYGAGGVVNGGGGIDAAQLAAMVKQGVAEALQQMPQPIVTVEEYSRVANRVEVRETRHDH